MGSLNEKKFPEEKFPLYPPLSEEAAEEAQQLIESFKEKLKIVAEEVIDDLYKDVVYYINSDSWRNFRNELMDGFRNYNNRKIQGQYDFKLIRKQIFEDFKDDIIKDLDQDNLETIKQLQERVKQLEEDYKRLLFDRLPDR